MVGAAPRVQQDPAAFVAAAFGGNAPAPTMIWLDGERRMTVTAILGHAPPSVRLRAWSSGDRSAFVFDEIAHTHPLTAGFVIESGRIVQAQVLVYRESRGREVQRTAFVNQYLGRALQADHELDGTIDGITGATLSVRALSRLARLALFLAAELQHDAADD